MPAKRSTKVVRAAPRRRRTADQARRAILDAARKRLADGGPEAIRLQEIARDVGVSHPAVLHHFGSREGLMLALARSAVQALDEELVRAIGDPSAQATPALVLERVFEALGASGLARLLGWYALSGFAPEPEHEEEFILRHVAGVLHSRLQLDAGETKAPRRSEAMFAVRLAAVALLGDAIYGRVIDHSLGAPTDRAGQRRFRVWLAEVLTQRLGLPPA